jgi:quinol-cytochrome oxidoreductase complex cytochrome b subunit
VKEQSEPTRLLRWIDTRLGLSHPLLRPVPRYAINPLYWLGALTVVAFVIQGVTGMIMMLYYIPNPMEAFPSTQYIFQSVFYGRFLESVHLYTAYAMIMLAFMHMMRGYFVSVHKKPREIMWFVGMVMGFVTLGFGFTGYLLPWTVVSKSATDVGVGMIDALPAPLSSLLSFLIIGAGGDATQLLRFYDLHVVILPAVLLVLLTVKMYMLETHGISEPVTALGETKPRRTIPIFPDVSLYLLELAAIFGAIMLLISVVFPLNLPPQYTPELASQFIPQPDWYFLWIYQLLKISVFEGAGLPVAMSVVTIIFLLLFLLPVIDRGETRKIRNRPLFVALGLIFVGEVFVLAYWGLITPGQVIPTEVAATVLGGSALLIALISLGLSKLINSQIKGHLPTNKASTQAITVVWAGPMLVGLLALGSVSISAFFGNSAQLVIGGVNFEALASLCLSATLLGAVFLGTFIFLYRLELRIGSVKRRIPLFEFGGVQNGSE